MKTAIAGFGLASVASFGAVTAASRKALDTFDRIGKLSKRTDSPTAFLQRMAIEAELAGASLEEVANGQVRLARSIDDAQHGLSTAVRAFQGLGVSFETLQGLKPDQQFYKVAQAISAMNDQTKRVAVATQVFGRSGANLLPLLDQIADNMDRITKRDVLSDSQIQQIEDMGDAANEAGWKLQSQLAKSLADVGRQVKLLSRAFHPGGFQKMLAEWHGVPQAEAAAAGDSSDELSTPSGRSSPIHGRMGGFRMGGADAVMRFRARAAARMPQGVGRPQNSLGGMGGMGFGLGSMAGLTSAALTRGNDNMSPVGRFMRGKAFDPATGSEEAMILKDALKELRGIKDGLLKY